MCQIEERKPEEILKSEFVEEYKCLHQDIWFRLTHINTSITILERIASYPLANIYSPTNDPFWEMVYWNFIYTSVVMFYTVTADNSSKGSPLTLNRLKNLIVNKWIRSSEKQPFQQKLRNAKFSISFKQVSSLIKDLRNKIIAHRDFTVVLSENPIPGITIQQFRSTYNEVQKLFSVCTFGGEHITNLYLNAFYRGQPVEKDIDHILDLILKDSPWLHQPERCAQFWPELRRQKTADELTELNKWRKKFDLPEA